jgi:hypothetical protein
MNPANKELQWALIGASDIAKTRKALGIDESVMWGEYFFLAALDKALATPK